MEFTLKTSLKTTAKDIYTTWLSSDGHTKMTGGAAIMSDKVDGEFTAWDGYIKGKNTILEPYSRIVQSWRTSEFQENEEDSIIEILLEEKNEQTQLTLIHSHVPESGEHYIKGWDTHYFQPMKKYFSIRY